MTARRTSTGLLAALALSCHATDQIPAPDLDGAPAGLLVALEGDVVGFVHVLDGPQSALPTFTREGSAQLYLLRYRCGLDVLGLEAGPQRLEAAPRAQLDLPSPERAAAFDLDNGEAWREIEVADLPPGVDEALKRLELPEFNRCRTTQATFTASDVQLDVPDEINLLSPTFALALEEEVALVGALLTDDLARTSTNGFGAYRLQGNVVRPDPAVQALGAILAATRTDDGDLWLMGPRDLFRGHPDRGFEVVTSTVFSHLPRRMILSGDPAGGELYLAVSADLGGVAGAFGSRRWLFELTDAGWRQLATADVENNYASVVDVAWLGPGRAIAVGVSASAGEATWVETHAVRGENVDASLHHAQRLPDGRPLVAGGGNVWIHEGGAWQEARHGPGDMSVSWVEFLDDGDLAAFGNASGPRVTQTLDGIGYCGPFSLGGARLYRFAPVGTGRWIAVQESLGSGQLRVSRIALTDGPKPLCP